MGATTFTEEYTSPVSAARHFKSLVDSHSLIPKPNLQYVSSIDLIQGNGGTGSIKQINLVDGGFFKFHVDEVNEETLTYSYSWILDSALEENNVEKITSEIKFEPTTDGGSVSKISTKYYTKGDFTLKEDTITESRAKSLEVFKAAENYLIQNPDVYA